jgi:hypothetical protein
MEKGSRTVALAVTLLALSILVGSYWMSKSVESSFAAVSNSIIVASRNTAQNQNGISNSQNDILNQAQAAAYLQLPEDRLLKVIDSIPHVRIGGQNIFSKQALSEWVQKSNFSVNVN